ncbi:hypothetical protein FisN_4Lh059 [Fistulifera solaris]|uniref:DUF676 domain-containing protein n=1 Tax=Fistulifera solaris TaxID=1519565 RepID=A0A1Z5KD46_FISSO|nr:hypothetical protein FisN_4Lh059 [Fistulifera solaris]|eukprot:GAX24240.1 hypothetical protein FisN_4Lh059 [Fistulifera solaris]
MERTTPISHPMRIFVYLIGLATLCPAIIGFTPFVIIGRSPLHGHRIRTCTVLAAPSEPPTTAVVTPLGSNVDSTLQSDDNSTKQRRRVSVLLCPAQFCVPDDYSDFLDRLSLLSQTDPSMSEIGTCRVAPLPRTEWIKVAKQLPTQEFFEARLNVPKTLDWYFQAIEKGLAEIFTEEGPDANICFVGHSIGGWVARAYLGGMSESSSSVSRLANQRCTSLITLGTPHVAPETALVDQTRGLIRSIDSQQECSSQALADRGIAVTCVCSSSMKANFFSVNVEDIVAAASYLPLLGRLDASVRGDGIVPLDLAFLEEPARRVIIDQCPLTNEKVRHSHVVPTPWNLWDGYASSIRLPSSFPSYTSDGVVPMWAKYIL